MFKSFLSQSFFARGSVGSLFVINITTVSKMLDFLMFAYLFINFFLSHFQNYPNETEPAEGAGPTSLRSPLPAFYC